MDFTKLKPPAPPNRCGVHVYLEPLLDAANLSAFKSALSNTDYTTSALIKDLNDELAADGVAWRAGHATMLKHRKGGCGCGVDYLAAS